MIEDDKMKKDIILNFSTKIISKAMFDGAYVNLSLNSNANFEKMSMAQKKFATILINGTVENWIYLNYIVNKLSSKPNSIKNQIRVLLCAGLYNLIFLDKKDEAIVVNRFVEYAKNNYPFAKGFVNYIFRSYLRNPFDIEKEKFDDITKYLSVKYSHNLWLVKELIEQYSLDETIKILQANNNHSKLYIRVNTKYYTRLEVLKMLEAEGVQAEVSEHSDSILITKLNKSIEELDAFKKGALYVQDISSMYVCDLMSANDSDKVLDLCAAPAGKSTHIAQRILDYKIVACDIYEHKINLIEENFERLKLKVDARLYDATIYNPKFSQAFDKVLVDAPCSGWGVIANKPEIKYSTNQQNVDLLIGIQNKILKNASKYVKKGGVLVYSTCTINKRENFDVVKQFLEENNDFMIDEKLDNCEIKCLDNLKSIFKNGVIELVQSNNLTAGFFACRLIKKID